MKEITIISLLMCLFIFGQAQTSNSSVQELGKVEWLRDYDAAVAQAKAKDKPILILFQEVPGCATCRNYGDNILSHPLIVDAIENEFIPLAIFNNKGGADKKILEKYGEPTWNNPVVRIVDSSGENIIERLSGNYSSQGLILHMSLALRTAGKGEPEYLSLLKEEMTATNTETAYYKMYCFWSGESHFGAKQGVVETEPGWLAGNEVVKVVFDKDQLKKKELDKYAAQSKCEPIAKKSKYKVDKDPQYYLKKSPYRYLPLSAIQKSKINAALARGADPQPFLSPTQKRWFAEAKSETVMYTKSLIKAWEQLEQGE